MIQDPQPRHALALFAFLGLAFALYAGSLANPYHLDDRLVVESHPDVVQDDGLWRLWAHDYWHTVGNGDDNLYRPLTVLAFHLDRRLGGGRPELTRGVNVVFLALLAWALWGWLVSVGVRRSLAWALGALFVLHPLQSSLVEYVVGRADLMAMSGVLGFLWLQAGGLQRTSWSAARLAGLTACAGLAFASKESGVILLPLAWLQAWARGSGSPARPRDPRYAGSRHYTVLLWTAGLPLLLYAFARGLIVGSGVSYGAGYASDPLMNPLVGLSLLERLPACFSIAAFYTRQIFLTDPSFWHVPEELPDWSTPSTWWGIGVAILGLAGFARAVHKRSLAAVALGFGLGQFLIVGQLIHPLAFYAANRQAEPFLIGACALAALGLNRVFARASRRAAVALLPATLLLGLPMVLQVQRVGRAWRTYEGFVGIDLGEHPEELDSITANAVALLEAGRYEKASSFAREATRRQPDYPGHWYVLGTALLESGDPEAAADALQRGLAASEGVRSFTGLRANILLNLAASELRRGRIKVAQRHLDKAETLRPRDERLLVNQAMLAEKRQDVPEMIRRYRQLSELDAKYANTLGELARSLRAQADEAERIGLSRRAAELRELARSAQSAGG